MKKISVATLKGLPDRNLGLTEHDVAFQTARYGYNDIVLSSGSHWKAIALDTLKDPMIWFLIGIGTLYLVVSDFAEALVLFVAILPLTLMDAFLHWRTQVSTIGLKKNLASYITAVRGSDEAMIDSRLLVPGDLVTVTSGTFLPADGIFVAARGLQVDESVLTGEAFPIQKHSTRINPFAYAEVGEISVAPDTIGLAGTRVLAGHGRLRILQTGSRTEYGEIVQSVAHMPHERTPLQQEITKLVRWLIAGAGLFCVILASVRIYQGHGWLDAILSAATLALAAVPEEFPIVFTFFLGVGVYRLAKKKALVRRAVSVENIGRTSHICTDKTGTITVGNLRLAHIDPAHGQSKIDILSASTTATNPTGSDPVDLAIQASAINAGVTPLLRQQVFPFTEDRKRETALAKNRNEKLTAFMKGAPETVLHMTNLSKEDREQWLAKTKKWATEGHKVLGVAQRAVDQDTLDRNIEPQSEYEFLGLLAFEDPPRKEVSEAIAYCKSNGINVLMITGDHLNTAIAIAKDIGLGGECPIAVSAEEDVTKFHDAWLHENPQYLATVNIVARCKPLQKLTIVNALKKSGALVAVTGDGVNDVPALKAADIGIAMGERGTQSAKEVSSIILSDDNFSTIVNAIKEGRQLFSNLRKSFEYLLLIHIPIVLTAALLPLAGYPLLYLPIHIVWLELIIHPSALFAFQEKTASEINPHISRNFFSKSDFARIVLIGTGITVAISIAFLSALGGKSDVLHARSMALAMITTWSASLLFSLTGFRTWTARLISSFTIVSSILLTQVPWISGRLHLSPLHLIDWGVVALTTIPFAVFVSFLPRIQRNK